MTISTARGRKARATTICRRGAAGAAAPPLRTSSLPGVAPTSRSKRWRAPCASPSMASAPTRSSTATAASRSPSARGARSSSAPARCRARSCCSYPASAQRRCLQRFGIPMVHELRGCRRKLAGPFAGAGDFRVHTTDHHQRRSQELVTGRKNGIGVCTDTRRTDGHRHQSGRHFRPCSRERGDAGRTVPRRDAVLGHGRLADAHLFRLHHVGLPAAPRVARARAHPLGRSARRAGDAAELSVDAKRPRHSGRRHQARAQARRDTSPRSLCERRIPARHRGPGRRRNSRVREKYRRDDLPPQRHVQNGRREARSDCGRRQRAQGSRRICPARGRLQRNADACFGQHQRPGRHDRRKSGRPDSCGGRVTQRTDRRHAEDFHRGHSCPAATPILRSPIRATEPSRSACRPSLSARAASPRQASSARELG